MSDIEKGIMIFTFLLGFFMFALINYFIVKWKKKHNFKTDNALFEKMFDKYEAKHNPNFDIKTSVLNNNYKKDIVYNSLDNHHKKLVDKGLYDSTSFEEDELEEDDYYYEDDK